ncbi:MAG: hypothetical protein QOE27_1625, partial [Solirubrobacteraceae bacterium]|nr:hypothetical protein [Solirubrobacteraceae bacterium]
MARMRRRLRSAALPLHRHSLPQVAVDGALVALAYYLAFQLRFDNGAPVSYAHLYTRTWPWVVAGTLVVLGISRVYQRRWRYVSQRDFQTLLRAVVVATIVLIGAVAIVRPVQNARGATVGLPNGVSAMYLLLALSFLGTARLLARSVHDRPVWGLRSRKDAREVLVVGAGDGGRLVVREMLRNAELGLRPVGFVDDDMAKRGLRIDGVRVRGTTEDLPRILDEAEPGEVIIAIPSAPGSLRKLVVRACRERGIPVRTLPTVFELLQGGSNP